MYEKKYPAISPSYGVFLRPDGGFVFPYEEHHGLKRALPQCELLNVQAAAILEKCTGLHTVEDIVAMLEREFEDTPLDLSSQVKSFLDIAFQKGYLTFHDTPTEMEGLLQGSTKYYIPTHVLMEVTSRCNLRCSHCLIGAGEPLTDELTVPSVLSILEQFSRMGVKTVNLSGGEILTREGWQTLAAFCTSRFSSSILTNGVLITEEAAEILKRCEEVYISLYGADPETHEKISQAKGSFERAVRGMSLLSERGIYVGASVLMVPFNLTQLEGMVKIALSAQCKVVRLGVVSPRGRAVDKGWELTEAEMKLLETLMNDLQQKYKGQIAIQWEEEKQRDDHRCGAGFTRWTVAPNGDVYPCPVFRISLGNLTRDDLRDICRSEAVVFLQELKAPHAALCSECQWLYKCKECHGEALLHWRKVDRCRWAEQFENAPELFKEVMKVRNSS